MIANLIKPASEWTPGAVGIFAGLDAEKYHTEAAGLSRSMAAHIVFESPAHMRYAMDHPEPPTKFMAVGTVVHCAVLEPDKLIGSYHIRPDTYPGQDRKKNPVTKPWSGNATWCQEWLEQHTDKPVLTREQHEHGLACCDAVRAHTELELMLRTGHAELSCFARFEGTLLRCRPDLMSEDADGRVWVTDLKKCQHADEDHFRWHAKDQHYDFQEAWYRFVLELCGIPVHSFRFAAVEEDPPHGVQVFRLRAGQWQERTPDVHRAIDIAVQCAESGRWPGYPEATKEIGWGTIT